MCCHAVWLLHISSDFGPRWRRLWQITILGTFVTSRVSSVSHHFGLDCFLQWITWNFGLWVYHLPELVVFTGQKPVPVEPKPITAFLDHGSVQKDVFFIQDHPAKIYAISWRKLLKAAVECRRNLPVEIWTKNRKGALPFGFPENRVTESIQICPKIPEFVQPDSKNDCVWNSWKDFLTFGVPTALGVFHQVISYHCRIERLTDVDSFLYSHIYSFPFFVCVFCWCGKGREYFCRFATTFFWTGKILSFGQHTLPRQISRLILPVEEEKRSESCPKDKQGSLSWRYSSRCSKCLIRWYNWTTTLKSWMTGLFLFQLGLYVHPFFFLEKWSNLTVAYFSNGIGSTTNYRW